MTERLPEQGTLVRTSCEHGAFSVLIPTEIVREMFRSAARITARYNAPETTQVTLIRDQIRGLAAEIGAAEAGSFPRFPDNEAGIKNTIAIFTLGLLSGRADLAALLKMHLHWERGIVAVHLSQDNIEVAIAGPDGAWDVSYSVGRQDTPVLNLH